jgi:hypothetical protein
VERTITVASIRTFETRKGGTRYVVRDTDGNEYTTFREHIGNAAMGLDGKRARIEFHEEQRGDFKAVDAAPWLVGESEPQEALPPDELFDKLKPFKERVAEDIRRAKDES